MSYMRDKGGIRLDVIDVTNDATLGIDAMKGPNALKLNGTDESARLTALSATAVAAGLPLRLPPATIMVGKWKPTSGCTYVGAAGSTTLKMHPSFQGASDRTVDLTDSVGVALMNITVDGNRSAYTGPATEQRHGIHGPHVTRLLLWNVVVTNTVGDGVYLGSNANGQTVGVTAWRLRCDGNWRNGMSIISCDGGTFVDCQFLNTAGTAPQAGIDIEPNDNASIVRNLKFVGCSIDLNAAFGVAITLYPGGTQGGITFTNCSMSRNGAGATSSGAYGVYLYSANDVEFSSCHADDNTLDGVWFNAGAFTDVRWFGGSICRNGHHGVNCQPTSAKTSAAAGTATILPTLKGVKWVDAVILDNGSATPNTYHGMLWDVTGSTPNTIDGLLIDGVTSGNRTTSNQRIGAVFTQSVTNLMIDRCDMRGNVTSAVTWSDDATTRKRGVVQGVSTATNVTAALTLPSISEVAVCNQTAAVTVTLPPNPEWDRDYEVMDNARTAATNNITVAPFAGQSWANGGANPVINTNGGVMAFRARGNFWRRVR